MKLEESLSGGYLALYGEIVDKDIYHMRDVQDIVSVNDASYVHEAGHKRPFNFDVDVVIDLGACVGIFSRYARELFPSSLVVAVEPDKNNCEIFRQFTNDGKTILVEKAIGFGKVWKNANAKNGSGENYITEGIAYPKNKMAKFGDNYEVSEVETVTLNELINEYVKEGQRFIVKIDIEGNEQVIFADGKEMTALKKADYIAGELHYFSLDGETNKAIRKKISEALLELQLTHNVEMNGLNFYATKK